MIAKKKKVSRNFVIKWTQSSKQDFTKGVTLGRLGKITEAKMCFEKHNEIVRK